MKSSWRSDGKNYGIIWEKNAIMIFRWRGEKNLKLKLEWKRFAFIFLIGDVDIKYLELIA